MREVIFISTLIFLFVGCNPKARTEDPREVLGFTDATTMRELASKAIGIANKILENQEQNFILKASWKDEQGNNHESAKSVKTVEIYLLRPKNYYPTFVKEEGNLNDFRAELENIEINKEHEYCGDTEDCVENLYSNFGIGPIVANVLKQQGSLEIAKTNPLSNYIALIDGDLQKFQMLFGQSIFGEQDMPGFENFIAIVLLHEIGHLNRSFSIQDIKELPKGNFEGYVKYFNLLNPEKKEEARADAYAAHLISKYARSNKSDLTLDDRRIILYIPIQAMYTYLYQLLDKSEGGRCRQYFDPTKTHPNLQLRYIAMSLIVSDKSNDLGQLSRYLGTRESLSKKRFATVNMECSSLDF